MTAASGDVPGWHLTFEQSTGACYGITVGEPDFKVALTKAEGHPWFVLGDVLIGHAVVGHDLLARHGVQPGDVVLTSP